MIYFILALAAGVFYREFTKWNNYTGKTTLGIVHTHLFVLGVLLFLIVALFCDKHNNLLQNNLFQKFFVLYNITLPFMTFMFLIRGTIQVLNITISHTTNAIISGIAGISHIFISAVLFLLFLSLKKVIK